MPVEAASNITHIEGYVVLAEPLQNFPPLTLLGLIHDDDEATHLGVLKDIAPTSTDAPEISDPGAAASFSGMNDQRFQMNVSVDVLGGILKTLGVGSAPGIAARTDREGKVAFAYTNVNQRSVSLIESINWLNHMEAQDKNSTSVLKSYGLITSENRLFLVTEVLSSSSIDLGVSTQATAGLSGAAALVTQPVSVHEDSSWGTSSTLEEKYQGTNSIVFAFKASQIMFDESKQCWITGSSDDEVARQLAMGGLKPNVFSRVADKIGHLFHHR
jgi:hypothetical protein